jgi:putative endonuclease
VNPAEGSRQAEPGGGRAAGPSPVELGRNAERLAARWYEDHGYEVLERNWRRRGGEVDLIVRSGRTVVFCEVKARSSDRFGTGAEAVVPAKQQRLRRLASRWLAELTPAAARSAIEVRFDVVSLTGGAIDVVEGAF